MEKAFVNQFRCPGDDTGPDKSLLFLTASNAVSLIEPSAKHSSRYTLEKFGIEFTYFGLFGREPSPFRIFMPRTLKMLPGRKEGAEVIATRPPRRRGVSN